jgi:hypothetical protein
MGDEAFF